MILDQLRQGWDSELECLGAVPAGLHDGCARRAEHIPCRACRSAARRALWHSSDSTVALSAGPSMIRWPFALNLAANFSFGSLSSSTRIPQEMRSSCRNNRVGFLLHKRLQRRGEFRVVPDTISSG